MCPCCCPSCHLQEFNVSLDDLDVDGPAPTTSNHPAVSTDGAPTAIDDAGGADPARAIIDRLNCAAAGKVAAGSTAGPASAPLMAPMPGPQPKRGLRATPEQQSRTGCIAADAPAAPASALVPGKSQEEEEAAAGAGKENMGAESPTLPTARVPQPDADLLLLGIPPTEKQPQLSDSFYLNSEEESEAAEASQPAPALPTQAAASKAAMAEAPDAADLCPAAAPVVAGATLPDTQDVLMADAAVEEELQAPQEEPQLDGAQGASDWAAGMEVAESAGCDPGTGVPGPAAPPPLLAAAMAIPTAAGLGTGQLQPDEESSADPALRVGGSNLG